MLADLGGGDGRFLLAVAKRLARRWPGVTGADLRPAGYRQRPRPARRSQRWAGAAKCAQGDIFDTLPTLNADIVTANLFLHHFDDAALARLLAAVAATGAGLHRLRAAPRPRLRWLGAHMVWALGANDVTRHDAVASVRAGFAGRELSALWPQGDWRLHERAAFPFSHVFTAPMLY